jgi:altronate dehydratase small subunit
MPRAFQIHAEYNVAVLLEDAAPGEIQIIGAASRVVVTSVPIKLCHKVATAPSEPGQAILKYGVRIGHASQAIRAGDWVHLHNLASDLDERSGTLDGETGAPTDTRYE